MFDIWSVCRWNFLDQELLQVRLVDFFIDLMPFCDLEQFAPQAHSHYRHHVCVRINVDVESSKDVECTCTKHAGQCMPPRHRQQLHVSEAQPWRLLLNLIRRIRVASCTGAHEFSANRYQNQKLSITIKVSQIPPRQFKSHSNQVRYCTTNLRVREGTAA